MERQYKDAMLAWLNKELAGKVGGETGLFVSEEYPIVDIMPMDEMEDWGNIEDVLAYFEIPGKAWSLIQRSCNPTWPRVDCEYYVLTHVAGARGCWLLWETKSDASQPEFVAAIKA